MTTAHAVPSDERGPDVQGDKGSGRATDQPTAGWPLAERIIARYGASPGVIATAPGLGHRLAAFAAERTPLLADVLRRWTPGGSGPWSAGVEPRTWWAGQRLRNEAGAPRLQRASQSAAATSLAMLRGGRSEQELADRADRRTVWGPAATTKPEAARLPHNSAGSVESQAGARTGPTSAEAEAPGIQTAETVQAGDAPQLTGRGGVHVGAPSTTIPAAPATELPVSLQRGKGTGSGVRRGLGPPTVQRYPAEAGPAQGDAGEAVRTARPSAGRPEGRQKVEVAQQASEEVATEMPFVQRAAPASASASTPTTSGAGKAAPTSPLPLGQPPVAAASAQPEAVETRVVPRAAAPGGFENDLAPINEGKAGRAAPSLAGNGEVLHPAAATRQLARGVEAGMPLVVRRATASEIAGRPAQRNVEAATETSLPLANRAEGPRPAESTQPPGTAMEAGRPLVQRATACEAVGQPAQQVVDPVAPTPPPLASHREGSRPAGTAQPPGIAMEARLPIMQRATASEIAGQLVRRSTYEPGPSPLGFAQESTTPRARRIAPGSEGGVAEARVTERAASPPALALAFRRANQPPAWQAKSTASRPVFANAPTISGLRISSAPDVLVFRQADASAGLHPPATAMSAGQPAARSRPAGAAGGAVPAPEEEPARPSTPETLDLERLADEVTAIIERRLVFERETRGL